jgi:hypothetical protein
LVQAALEEMQYQVLLEEEPLVVIQSLVASHPQAVEVVDVGMEALAALLEAMAAQAAAAVQAMLLAVQAQVGKEIMEEQQLPLLLLAAAALAQ